MIFHFLKKNFALYFSIITAKFILSKSAESDVLQNLLQNEDIKNTWQSHALEICIRPAYGKRASKKCEQKRMGYGSLGVELLNDSPLIFKISNFVTEKYLDSIESSYNKSSEIESQRVEGHSYSKGYQGRRANGLWLEHTVPIMRPLFHRIQNTLRINPAIAEEFLILKYEKMGHYAIHYDHLEPMPVDYDDGWFAYYGNRLATSLLIVKTATKGGYTVFPRLNLTIQPERGDLIVWFNADSNDKRENDALHAACPIEHGTKMAISLWVRGNFQENLQCATQNAGYDIHNIFRDKFAKNEPKISKNLLHRPKIPQWIFE